MMTRLRRITLRDLALFVVIAGVVAVSTVCGAQEIGLEGERAEAGTDAVQDEPAQSQLSEEQEHTAEPLTLTLTPEAGHCESERAREDWTWETNGERVTYGWLLPAEAIVRWAVEGGVGPYTLVIDGQHADVEGRSFSGATGRGSVACANTSVSWRWVEWLDGSVRYYESDPEVDSGWKTVRATVTDANGDTAEATVRFYVILSEPGQLLKRGETYRISGHLFTIPASFDMEFGYISTGSSGPGYQQFIIAGTDPIVSILLRVDNFTEVSREVPAQHGATGSSDDQASQQRKFNAALDAFAASLDQPPYN